MSNVHYDILIDGKPYEGNESLEVALHLYATLDNTCLRDYYGHVKGLKVTDGSQVEKQLKLFPDEAFPYFKEKEPSTTNVEVLNSENEVVLTL